MATQDYTRFEELVRRHNAAYVDLGLVDLTGRLRRVTLPVSAVTPAILEEGVGFDGSSYGFVEVEHSDMVMVPDLSTGHLDPFREAPTLSFLSSVHLACDGLPLSQQDTRGILKRALELLRATGVADQLLVAPEYEFYIFDEVEFHSGTTRCSYHVQGRENSDTKAYHASNPGDLHTAFRDEATGMLVERGMKLRYHHHEVGGHGQQEIESDLEPVLDAADHAVMVRYVLKNLAFRHGLQVTFMPKPLYKQAGNGWHVHQMATRDGVNLFHDPSGLVGLSSTALAWIGGLLSKGGALSGISNASTNSFKRLTRGYEAPVSLTFGPADRTAAVRIPRWARGEATRVEYRAGDFTGNPYLTLAALVMAGIDGVRRGADPVAEGYGPAEDLDRENVRTLPFSLWAALRALEEDHEFLLRGDVFPAEVLRKWIHLKRAENEDVSRRPHPQEYIRYFDL